MEPRASPICFGGPLSRDIRRSRPRPSSGERDVDRNNRRRAAVDPAAGARRRRGARRGVRRHRHEPALYAEDRARLHRAASGFGRDTRRAVADLMDAVPHHDGQVCQYRHARRQRRRRRHHRADDPARRQEASAAHHYRGRPVRSGAHLRRRRDHACDFGALGARRRGADRAEFADLRVARGDGDPAGAVCDPAVRDGGDRARIRSDHAPLVCSDCGARRLRRPAAPVGLCCGRSPLRPQLSVERRIAGISGARRRVSVRDRGRGAVRRHGTFWAETDPSVLEPHRLSGSHSQLCRPGRDRPRGRADRRQYLLPALPRAAADAADRAGDGRHRHSQPVDHHRRLFDDPPGDAARLAAADENHSNLAGGLRPDLRGLGELAAHDRDPRPDHRLRQVR